MYSAMPSVSATNHSLAESSRTDVGLAIEELSISGAPPGHGHGDMQGDEDYDDGRVPFGQNVEHACR